jgi:hypothetical protein
MSSAGASPQLEEYDEDEDDERGDKTVEAERR